MNFNLFFTKLLIDSKLLIYIILIMFFTVSLNAAPASNLPVSLRQPDGKIVNCFVSGDEFHFRYHDKDNYTIIQDEKNGYWVYAVKSNGKLGSSGLIVGKDIPLNLEKGIDISVEEKKSKRASILNNRNNRSLGISKGNFNNIGIFIRFADEPEFSEDIKYYDSVFNTSIRSIKNYFYEESYHKLNLTTYFYPKTEGKIKSYQDKNPRGYYKRYNETSNPKGYKSQEEIIQREEELLNGAIEFIKNALPDDINFDMNNDGKIDNISFIVSGTMFYSELLWPHYSEFTNPIGLKNKRVFGYVMVGNVENREREYFFNTACHEIGHSIGFPDLYGSGEPVGRWDMMSRNIGHSGAWAKHKYTGWIESIPEVEKEGKYTINALQNPENNCYKIKSAMMTDEFIVVEYRKRDSLFEKDIPGDGLLITRINPNVSGNGTGTDEVYYYRPEITGNPNQDIMNAFFSLESGRTRISRTTNPSLVFSDQDNPEIEIYDIGSSKGEFTTFSVKRKNKITAKISKCMDSSKAGSFSIIINYMFPKQDNKWTVSIVSGGSWMKIISDSAGLSNDQISIEYDENNSDFFRKGTIKITDTVSIGGPFYVSFIQSQKKMLYESGNNNSSNAANNILPGKLISGRIEQEGEVDYYAFPANEGDYIEMLYSEQTSADYGAINIYKKGYDFLNLKTTRDGNLIKGSISIPKTGIYYIRISSILGKYNFNYSLVLSNSNFIFTAPIIKSFTVSGKDRNSLFAFININTSGSPTILKIEYGTNNNYGNTIEFDNIYLESVLNGFDISLSKRIQILEPETKYHYRLITQNNIGISYSLDCESIINPLNSCVMEFEPNDSRAYANLIYYGDSIKGSINPIDDKDYFMLYAYSNDTLDINLYDTSGQFRCYFEFLDDILPYPIAGSSMNDDNITLKYVIKKSGYYYINVKSSYGNNAIVNYLLTLDKYKYYSPKIKEFNINTASYCSAQLFYLVSTRGLLTKLYIEYGLTRKLGKKMLIKNIDPYLFDSWDFPTIFLFEPNSTYYCRLVAENEMGTNYSEIKSITTIQKPEGIIILPYSQRANFYDIIFTKNNNIILGCDYSGIVRSADEGKTWEKYGTNISSIYHFSTPDKVNILAISPWKIYKSTNSGESWITISEKISYINLIDYVTPNIAYIYIENNSIRSILKSIDGGKTWNYSTTGIKQQINCIKFFNENTGFVAGDNGLLLKTIDGGLNWISLNIDTSYYIKSICFKDINNVYMVGFKKNSINSITSILLRTTDSGENWKLENLSKNKELNFITFNDKNKGIIVGNEGIILKTIDNGDNWIQQPSGTLNNLTSACFIDPNMVIIVGSISTIIKYNFSSSVAYEPTNFQLSNNYPNPFNSQTTIEYSIPEDALVKIKIYDLLGREIEEILNENKKAGRYGVSWQPKNISTGVYYYRIEAGRYKETKKLLYLK